MLNINLHLQNLYTYVFTKERQKIIAGLYELEGMFVNRWVGLFGSKKEIKRETDTLHDKAHDLLWRPLQK